MSRRPIPVSTPRMPPRTPRTDFADAVRKAEPSPEALPLTHLTDGYHLRSIMEGGQLEPTLCTVFEEPLLYFFYGRPAYRVAPNVESNGFDAYWPVCFVMRGSAVRPRRIYPFDSGAFHNGRFSGFLHHGMIKEDFELDVDPDTPGRLIRLFWPDAKSYFDNRDAFTPSAGGLDFELKHYGEVIRANSNEPFDDRHSAVEIQTEHSVALKDNILAAIMPVDFASEAVRQRFEDIGALVLPFDTFRRQHAKEMVGQIYAICRDLYDGKHGMPSSW